MPKGKTQPFGNSRGSGPTRCASTGAVREREGAAIGTNVNDSLRDLRRMAFFTKEHAATNISDDALDDTETYKLRVMHNQCVRRRKKQVDNRSSAKIAPALSATTPRGGASKATASNTTSDEQWEDLSAAERMRRLCGMLEKDLGQTKRHLASPTMWIPNILERTHSDTSDPDNREYARRAVEWRFRRSLAHRMEDEEEREEVVRTFASAIELLIQAHGSLRVGFAQLDVQGRGELDRIDFEKGLGALGLQAPTGVLSKIFILLDQDLDCAITYEDIHRFEPRAAAFDREGVPHAEETLVLDTKCHQRVRNQLVRQRKCGVMHNLCLPLGVRNANVSLKEVEMRKVENSDRKSLDWKVEKSNRLLPTTRLLG